MAKDEKNEDAGRKDAPADKLNEDTTSDTASETTAKTDETADAAAETETKSKSEKIDKAKAKKDKAKDAADEAVDSARKPVKGIHPALPIAAAIIGIVGLILAGVLYFRPGLDYTNEAYTDRATTDAVATAASENAKQLVGIDYETLDEYVDNLPNIMTPGLEDELMKSWDQLADTYKQAKTKVDVSISDVGVTYLEENRAEVLIAQSVSVTQDGQAAGSTDGTYLVRLEKIDGDWKLSSIPDLPS